MKYNKYTKACTKKANTISCLSCISWFAITSKYKYKPASNHITITALNDDKWRHVAFVQHPDGTIEIFLDYACKVSVNLTISRTARTLRP